MAQVNITAEPFILTTSASAGLLASIYAEPFILHITAAATLSPYVYVVDSGNNRVQAFDYDGNFVFSFGEYGTGDGQFDNPYGITTDDTYLYVTDSGNNRVEVFDMRGSYQYQFGGYGTGLGQFDNPKGIAVDDNYLYVVDSDNNRFQIFTKDGIFLYTYGEYGSGDGQFDHPTDCSVDDYYIYIDDTGNNRTVILKKSIPFNAYLYGFIQPLDANLHLYSNSIKADLELPTLELSANAIGSGIGQIETTLPPLSISARSGGRAQLDLPDLDASIYIIAGTATTLSLKLPPLSITSTVRNAEYSTIALAIPPLSSTLRLITGNVCKIRFTLPSLSAYTGSRTGSSIKAELVLPSLDIHNHLSTGSLMTMALGLPPIYINIQGTIIPVSVTYKGIAINTRTGAVTEYDSFNFNSIVEYKGQCLTASDNGIYLITGDKDDGNNINAWIKTGIIDMDRDIVRAIDEMWVTGRNGRITLTCTLDEANTLSYSTIPINNKSTGTRIKLPKGVKNRFIEFGLSNNGGSDFEVQSMKLMVKPIRRKVR